MTSKEDAVRSVIDGLLSDSARKAVIDMSLSVAGREMMRDLMPGNRYGRVDVYYQMIRSMVKSGLSDADVVSKLFETAFDHGEAAEALAQWHRDMGAGR